MLTNRKQFSYSPGNGCIWHIVMMLSIFFIFSIITVYPAIAFTSSPQLNALPKAAPSTADIVGPAGSAVSFVAHSEMGADQVWTARRYGITQGISHAYGSPIRITTDLSDEGLTEAAFGFIRQNEEDLGFAGIEPVIRSISSPPNYKVVSVSAEIDGITIYDAYVVLSINDRGELALLKARGFGSQVSGTFRISERQAITSARSTVEAEEGDADLIRIYYPERENDQIILKPAYRIEINTPNPAFQPTAFVSAEDGSLLASENRVHFLDITGTTAGMYHPLYGRDEPEDGVFSREGIWVNNELVTVSDEEGEFQLEIAEEDLPVNLSSILLGWWVSVGVWEGNGWVRGASYDMEIEEGEEAVDIEIVWNEDNSRDDERDLYFHVNRVHDYWKELVPDWEEMDYPMLAVCNLEMDNAFSSPQGIFFGRGDQFDNFATYADVVYHEYAHSVTRRQYGQNALPYQGESGAMNEAWSDYFACTLTNEPQIGEGGLLGENRVMRNIDNDMMYPDDLVGQVHADSRIISAAMWHTREELGAEYCDLLFHSARFHYARSFETYLMDVMITDDDNGDLTDGTPNYEEIYDAFGRHGIYPLGVEAYGLFDFVFSDEVEGAEGNGDGILDPGETIGLSMVIFRGGRLEGQEGEETIVRMRSSHESIEIINNDIEVPDLALGSSADLPEPIVFEISDETETSFADLVFSISSDGENFVDMDTMRIILGRAPLLVVKDGFGGFDRTQWIRDPLDELSLIYEEFETADNQLAEENYFNRFHTIIYFSGDARDGLLIEEFQTRLADYIDQGGNVLMTGQHFDAVDGAAQFVANYFGAITTQDSLRGIGMNGVEDDPISADMQLILGGGNSASNQVSPGGVEAFNEAIEIFHWARVGGSPAAGVRMELDETESRTVYLAFGLEAVGGAGPSNSRTEITESILHWFDHPVSVSNELTSPIAFEIGKAYPNPFNSRINFPFSLSQTGQVKLNIYDSLGRVVFNDNSYRNSGVQLWSLNTAGWGTGVYFVNLHAEGKTHISRITYLK